MGNQMFLLLPSMSLCAFLFSFSSLCFTPFSLQDDEDPNEKSHSEDDVNEDTGEIENVRVVVRVRPIDQIEIDAGSANVVKVDKLNRCINVTRINASSSSAVSEPPKRYYFDNVFDEDSTQVCILQSIYSSVCCLCANFGFFFSFLCLCRLSSLGGWWCFAFILGFFFLLRSFRFDFNRQWQPNTHNSLCCV